MQEQECQLSHPHQLTLNPTSGKSLMVTVTTLMYALLKTTVLEVMIVIVSVVVSVVVVTILSA
jgi:hypothetical protein